MLDVSEVVVQYQVSSDKGELAKITQIRLQCWFQGQIVGANINKMFDFYNKNTLYS